MIVAESPFLVVLPPPEKAGMALNAKALSIYSRAVWRRHLPSPLAQQLKRRKS
jgi:hypothetical protein